MDLKNLLKVAINASIRGGETIMKVYNSDFQVEKKSDDSPLTIADKNCHDIIEHFLKKTELPILSEEGASIKFSERKNWDYFWLVDPLDGTKEFIKRNGEFTVNIALIFKGKPIMGVIFVPVKQHLYFAMQDLGSYKIVYKSLVKNLDDLVLRSEKLPIKNNRTNYVIVGSRSHMSKETELFFEEKKKIYENVELLSVGSSLKLCMVAEGRADAYPRYAPTMEWDTAAGHAIAKYAGYSVLKFLSNNELSYNKKELLNPWFLVSKQ